MFESHVKVYGDVPIKCVSFFFFFSQKSLKEGPILWKLQKINK